MRRSNPNKEALVTKAPAPTYAKQSDMTSVQAAVAAGAGAVAALQTSQATQDTTISGKQDKAPNDGSVYVQQNGNWIKLTGAVVAALPPT